VKGLQKIDYRLGIIDRRIKFLTRLNPLNPKKEQQKFFRAITQNKIYNPCFRYKPITINTSRLREEITSLSIPIPSVRDEQWFFARHLAKKRKRALQKLEAVRQRGTVKFSVHAQGLFGKPDESQLAYAYAQLTPDACAYFSTIHDSLSASEAASALQGHIDKYALPWRMRLRKSISSKAGLDSRSKYLLIKTGERFSAEEVQSLAIHEIETHIFRKENGLLQRFPYLFGEGFAGPPTTEEGLAFFNETCGPHDPRRMLVVAARTIGVHLAQTQSFYKVFQKLHALGLPPSYAWNVTLRVKRGMSDTSKPGAFPKDHHYLKGYLGVKDFLNRGGDMRLLYTGKLNIANAESLIKFGVETKEPKYLPKHFR